MCKENGALSEVNIIPDGLDVYLKNVNVDIKNNEGLITGRAYQVAVDGAVCDTIDGMQTVVGFSGCGKDRFADEIKSVEIRHLVRVEDKVFYVVTRKGENGYDVYGGPVGNGNKGKGGYVNVMVSYVGHRDGFTDKENKFFEDHKLFKT